MTYKSIREETLKDKELSKIIKELKKKSNMIDFEFTIDGDILFRRQRVVVPSTLQTAILHRTHGISKIKQLTRCYVCWKAINKDKERLIRMCKACVNVKNSPVKTPLHSQKEPENNWQRIYIDYTGPYQGHHFLQGDLWKCNSPILMKLCRTHLQNIEK